MGIMKRAALRARAVQALRRVAAVIADRDVTDVKPSVLDALERIDEAHAAYKAHARVLDGLVRTAEAARACAASIQSAAYPTVDRSAGEDGDDSLAGLRQRLERARNVASAMEIARYRLCTAAEVAQ